MRRRLFTLGSAVSLLLCVSTVVLWVRSYYASDLLLFAGPEADWYFWNHKDQLRFAHAVPTDAWVKGVRAGMPRGWSLRVGESVALERVPGSNVYIWSHGFGLVTGERWGEYHHEILFPHWAAVLVAALLPLNLITAQIRRRYRPLPGNCRRCGYDLRATPDRCPECGTPVVPNAVPSKNPGISN